MVQVAPAVLLLLRRGDRPFLGSEGFRTNLRADPSIPLVFRLDAGCLPWLGPQCPRFSRKGLVWTYLTS